MKQKIEDCFCALDIDSVEEVSLKDIKKFERTALDCIEGVGDSYDVMRSAVVMSQLI